MEENKTIKIMLNEKIISLTIGVLKDGMAVPPIIVNDRTMIPLRYIAEALDANIVWNGQNETISIYK